MNGNLTKEYPANVLKSNESPWIAVDLNHASKYQQAIPLARQLLKIRERVLGPEHPDTAISLDNLAGLYRRALAICEEALGPKHPLTATILGNLAGNQLPAHSASCYPRLLPA